MKIFFDTKFYYLTLRFKECKKEINIVEFFACLKVILNEKFPFKTHYI
jgi:hypothetical protein